MSKHLSPAYLVFTSTSPSTPNELLSNSLTRSVDSLSLEKKQAISPHQDSTSNSTGKWKTEHEERSLNQKHRNEVATLKGKTLPEEIVIDLIESLPSGQVIHCSNILGETGIQHVTFNYNTESSLTIYKVSDLKKQLNQLRVSNSQSNQLRMHSSNVSHNKPSKNKAIIKKFKNILKKKRYASALNLLKDPKVFEELRKDKGFETNALIVECESYQGSSCQNESSTYKFDLNDLQKSAEIGCKKLIRYLIQDQKCLITGKNQRGQTILHLSVKSGSLETVKYICNQGDIKKIINSPDQFGKTPLMYGAMNKSDEHYQIVEYILSRLKEFKMDLNQKDYQGFSVLDYAAGFSDKPKLLDLLIKNGTTYNFSNPGFGIHTLNYFLYLYAQGRGSSNNFDAIFNKLYAIYPAPKGGIYVPLHNPDCFKSFISQLEIQDVLSDLLHYLVSDKNINYTKILVDHLINKGDEGAKSILDADTNGNFNPLMLAAGVGDDNLEIIQVLLEAGASINHGNSSGETALSISISSKSNKIFDRLVEDNKINLNYTNNFTGETYLHVAIRNKNLYALKYLVDKDLDILLHNTIYGASVIQYCVYYCEKALDMVLPFDSNTKRELLECLQSEFQLRKQAHLKNIKHVIEKGIISPKRAKYIGHLLHYSSDGEEGEKDSINVNVIPKDAKEFAITDNNHGSISVVIERADDNIEIKKKQPEYDSLSEEEKNIYTLLNNSSLSHEQKMNHFMETYLSRDSLFELSRRALESILVVTVLEKFNQTGKLIDFEGKQIKTDTIKLNEESHETWLSGSLTSNSMDIILIPECLKEYKEQIKSTGPKGREIVFLDENHLDEIDDKKLYIGFVDSKILNVDYKKKSGASSDAQIFSPNFEPFLKLYLKKFGTLITHIVRCETKLLGIAETWKNKRRVMNFSDTDVPDEDIALILAEKSRLSSLQQLHLDNSQAGKFTLKALDTLLKTHTGLWECIYPTEWKHPSHYELLAGIQRAVRNNRYRMWHIQLLFILALVVHLQGLLPEPPVLLQRCEWLYKQILTFLDWPIIERRMFQAIITISQKRSSSSSLIENKYVIEQSKILTAYSQPEKEMESEIKDSKEKGRSNSLNTDCESIQDIFPCISAETEYQLYQPIAQLSKELAGNSIDATIARGFYITKPDDNLCSADKILKVYTTKREKIFKLKHQVKIVTEEYNESCSEEKLRYHVGNNKLLNFKTDLLTTSLEVKSHALRQFNFSAARTGFFQDFHFRYIFPTSSATPMFFKESKLNEKIFFDGDMRTNNPSQLALNYTEKNFNVTASEIFLLSLGTGDYILDPLELYKNASLLFWGNPKNLANFFSEGVEHHIHNKYVISLPVLQGNIDDFSRLRHKNLGVWYRKATAQGHVRSAQILSSSSFLSSGGGKNSGHTTQKPSNEKLGLKSR